MQTRMCQLMTIKMAKELGIANKNISKLAEEGYNTFIIDTNCLFGGEIQTLDYFFTCRSLQGMKEKKVFLF